MPKFTVEIKLHWNVAEAYHMINESLPTPRYVLPLIYLMFLIDNGEITLLREKITQSSNSSIIKFQALNE